MQYLAIVPNVNLHLPAELRLASADHPVRGVAFQYKHWFPGHSMFSSKSFRHDQRLDGFKSFKSPAYFGGRNSRIESDRDCEFGLGDDLPASLF